MKGVSNEMYSLMAKCIANEASVNELVVMDSLLKENEELIVIFNELKQYFQLKEKPETKDPTSAFEKLNNRIQKMTNL
jgi:hypothetical protein